MRNEMKLVAHVICVPFDLGVGSLRNLFVTLTSLLFQTYGSAVFRVFDRKHRS
jgi:hypothetical protein